MSATRTIGVIDYGGGNIRSLVKALETLGAAPRMVTSPGQMEDLDLLFFPGQGAFGDCMGKLAKLGLVDPLVAWINADKPFFGICVGYQLLFDGSEESPGQPGLGVLEGSVTRFPESELKVPLMGWNSARLRDPARSPWQGLGPAPYVYFVHSYFPSPSDPALAAAATDYGVEFTGAIQRGRLVATQFHPEKSQKAGMRLIANFLAEHSGLMLCGR
jgi:imidazole glycerol phosphate synthase glutamine amidotransferase subunit